MRLILEVLRYVNTITFMLAPCFARSKAALTWPCWRNRSLPLTRRDFDFNYLHHLSIRKITHDDIINIFHVTGPLWMESTGSQWFPSQRPVMWNCDVFFDLHLNELLSKPLRYWWFEMPRAHYGVTVMRKCKHTFVLYVSSKPFTT